MANSLVRVEAALVEDTPDTPWHVIIKDQDGELIPLAGFHEEKIARSYSAKMDTLILALQSAFEQPNWVNILVTIHDRLGPDLL